MLEKKIKYVVYVLSFLIIIVLFAVIYGMYIKISSKASKNYNMDKIDKIVSLTLIKNQEIKNMQVIDNNRILIIVGNDDEIQGIIFNVDTQKIIQRIKK